MICPQIIPTTKKKIELETLEIIIVVSKLQSVGCLISDNYDKENHPNISNNNATTDLPGLNCDSLSEPCIPQKSLGFGCQVPFGWQSDMYSLSSEFTELPS